MAAGWYSDPTGRKEHRYWDGKAWTEHTSAGGEQSTDEITGDYAAPTPQVPQMAQAPFAPAPRKRAVWPWVLVGLFVAMLGGCALVVVAVGVGVNEAVNELNEEQARHAITREQFDSIAIGTTRQQLIDTLGKEPEDVQEFISEGVFDETEVNTSCVYYNRTGGEFGDRFQFCFDGDTLRSKNSY